VLQCISKLYSHLRERSHDPSPDIPPPQNDRHSSRNDARKSQGLRTPVKVRVSSLRSPTGTSPLTDPPCAIVRSVCRNKGDLGKQLNELKKELSGLRVQKISGGSTNKVTKMFVSSHLERGNADRLACFAPVAIPFESRSLGC
jgi:hypothetical protein